MTAIESVFQLSQAHAQTGLRGGPIDCALSVFAGRADDLVGAASIEHGQGGHSAGGWQLGLRALPPCECQIRLEVGAPQVRA